jgi:hypothetical protein
MTYHDYLICQAEAHWAAARALPQPLLHTMLNEGINVDQEHRMFNLTNQGI